MEPCSGPTFALQVLIVVLGALNVALATWLAHRRARADRRDNGHQLRCSQRSDASGSSRGPIVGP